jgi:hypothetical protein
VPQSWISGALKATEPCANCHSSLGLRSGRLLPRW